MNLDHDVCYRALLTRDARFDGRFFTGVKTTGVYCRPICPARTPKPENVTFFLSAAAAQAAGFRPCLRCRPETAPDGAAWRGSSNTVARGLVLIEQGVLDNQSVEQLACRLGVGERQLRRLFQLHLGASPLAVAQTRRLLLAKQLIHETNLSMTEVAFAAGFQSVRRYNETFRQLFGRSPSTLRRTQVSGPGANGEVTVLLRYRPPYDWPAILSYLSARAIPGVEVISDGTYCRNIEIDGVKGAVFVSPDSGTALRATIRTSKLSSLSRIIARLRRMFDLSADPEAIGAHLGEDPFLAPLVAARPGLRVPGAWDGFELAVRAILGQQITVRAATQLLGKLVARYGTALGDASLCEFGLTHVFPCPEQVMDRNLAGLGIPKQRAAAVSSLASALAAEPEILDKLMPFEDATAHLRGFAGVGEWTSQYIAMRSLHDPDAFPAGDAALLRAVADKDGHRPTPAELMRRAERWRPWRAYAAQYLWHSLSMSANSASSINQSARTLEDSQTTRRWKPPSSWESLVPSFG